MRATAVPSKTSALVTKVVPSLCGSNTQTWQDFTPVVDAFPRDAAGRVEYIDDDVSGLHAERKAELQFLIELTAEPKGAAVRPSALIDVAPTKSAIVRAASRIARCPRVLCWSSPTR
jgi:hypothetical protein